MGRRGHAAIVPPPAKVTSRKHARRLTSSYHEITHRLASAASDAERAACRSELDAMGGVTAYQQASALNTALNSTSRWVARELRGGPPVAGAAHPRVLEIGAINTQLLDAPGLRVRAIDLHALEPRIEQCDFFSLAHGGELDASTGATVAYDAVVCSMVLNCVPGERRRFEMLLGIRAQLRAGGRAFITVPRSCLDHSFTLSEASFCDALAAVGLPRVPAPPAADAAKKSGAPDSTKIAFFDCVAGLPNADAARRFQRARHEARAKSRAVQHDAAGARSGRPHKGKSAGAAFDVDVGGYLGFGVRVERSYDPPAGRASKEQALCRDEFLRQVGSGALSGAASAAELAEGAGAEVARRSARAAAAPAAREAAASAEAEVEASAGDASAWHAAIDAESSRHDVARLDYAAWRWYGGREWGGAEEARARAEWIFGGDSAAPPGSAQERSGWQWSAGGWTQAAPWAAAPAAAPAPVGLAPPARTSASAPKPKRTRRIGLMDVPGTASARRLEARLWCARGCWWRRRALGLGAKRRR